jgi:biofilm PGA synthesis N-glycosyltransferase PgaC
VLRFRLRNSRIFATRYMLTVTLFWSTAILLVYTYAGYPLLIWLWDKLVRRAHTRSVIQPRISILVIARNEEARIAGKLENLLALNYPHELLEIVLASDASTDATVALAQHYSASGVKVLAFDRHRGKPAVLNEVVPQLQGELVVLMDARQRIHPDAVQQLVNNFADPAVGAVSGELHLQDGAMEHGGTSGVGVYWRYEKFIRQHESRIDSTIGVSGALYALRPELFMPIPEDTLLDDVLIPMQIVRKGYRVLFDPTAHAYEPVSATPQQEFQRKVRTIAGNYQLFWQQPWLLDPLANRLWLQTVSHKLSRLLSPVCLVLVLVASAILWDQPFYGVVLLLQLMFYSAALSGQVVPRLASKRVWCSVPYAFCLLNWSTVVGLVRFVRKQQRVTWQQAKDCTPQ